MAQTKTCLHTSEYNATSAGDPLPTPPSLAFSSIADARFYLAHALDSRIPERRRAAPRILCDCRPRLWTGVYTAAAVVDVIRCVVVLLSQLILRCPGIHSIGEYKLYKPPPRR